MKRLIYAAESTASFEDYVISLINKTELGNMIKETKVVGQDGSLIELTLKDPFRSKYVRRVDWFNNTVSVVPSSDWMSYGSPDCWLILNPKRSDTVNINAINKLVDKINEITSRYERAMFKEKMRESAAPGKKDLSKTFVLPDSDGDTMTVSDAIESMTHECWSNYPECTRSRLANIIIEHLEDPDIYGLIRGVDFDKKDITRAIDNYYQNL